MAVHVPCHTHNMVMYISDLGEKSHLSVHKELGSLGGTGLTPTHKCGSEHVCTFSTGACTWLHVGSMLVSSFYQCDCSQSPFKIISLL